MAIQDFKTSIRMNSINKQKINRTKDIFLVHLLLILSEEEFPLNGILNFTHNYKFWGLVTSQKNLNKFYNENRGYKSVNLDNAGIIISHIFVI